jgi:hypothetical protein
MSSSMRLRRAGLVTVLTLGVLSMHGLGTGVTDHRVDSTATTAVDAMLGMDPHTGGGDHGAEGHQDRGHGPMHAIGQVCLWLIAGGALFVVTRALARPRGTSAQAAGHPDRAATPPAPVGRSPNPPLAMVPLRC